MIATIGEDHKSGLEVAQRSLSVLRNAPYCRPSIPYVDIIGGVAPGIAPHLHECTLTNTSPPYNARSCSCCFCFAFFASQISFSHSSFEAHANIDCTHELASSYTEHPTHINSERKHVNRKHTIAGLLQHTCCYQRHLQGEGRLDPG